MADGSSHNDAGYDAAGYAGEAHGAAESVFPPFDPTYFSSQLFWLTITFVALYIVLSRVALPRIATVIEERRDKIAEDLDHAAELKLESENAVAAYEKALADAKAKAVAIAAETREGLDGEIAEMQADVDQRLSEKLEAAEKRIEDSKNEALGHIRDIASETAETIVGELLGAAGGDAESAKTAVAAELAARG